MGKPQARLEPHVVRLVLIVVVKSQVRVRKWRELTARRRRIHSRGGEEGERLREDDAPICHHVEKIRGIRPVAAVPGVDDGEQEVEVHKVVLWQVRQLQRANRIDVSPTQEVARETVSTKALDALTAHVSAFW